MSESIDLLLQWVASHPHLAGLIVGLLAFSESLAGVGLVVPGAMVMFGVGALIAAGALEFWSVYAWSVVGAALGDGLSYWLGRHFHGTIRRYWPFSRHPDWLEKGEDFFHRHGGKSVFLGRFIGPIRPVIPVVAGMLDMPPSRFYRVNILSALGWAPVYLLPGMAFGASLAVAGEVAGRLALLVVVLLVLGWLLVRVTVMVFRFLAPRAPVWTRELLVWGRRNTFAARVVDSLVDPERPATLGLAVSGALLVGAVWLFLGVAEDVWNGDPLVQADQGIFNLLQGLRTPWGDRIMVAITELGDAPVNVTLVLGVLAWLAWRRAWRTALYWVGVVASAAVLVAGIKWLFGVPRPVDLYAGASSYAFPSGHAAMSMVLYGFLAFLVSRVIQPERRWLPFAVAAVFIGAIGFSRLYLGAHWFSDVLGGYSGGLAWISLLAIAYQRHGLPRHSLRGLAPVALAVLVPVAGFHVWHRHAEDLERYAPRYEPRQVEARTWPDMGWRDLPAWRLDLKGERGQPLNIQYAGSLDELRPMLTAANWRAPVPLSAATALRWLSPELDALERPVLPQVHAGRNESLRLVRPLDAHPDEVLVLRLWPADARLSTGQTLWVGTVSRVRIRAYLGLVYLPRTVSPLSPPERSLFAGIRVREVVRPDGGSVLLLSAGG